MLSVNLRIFFNNRIIALSLKAFQIELADDDDVVGGWGVEDDTMWMSESI